MGCVDKLESVPKRVGIVDVAREAGVSTATVSFVLAGKAPVADATREHVLGLSAASAINGTGMLVHCVVGRRGLFRPSCRTLQTRFTQNSLQPSNMQQAVGAGCSR